MWTTPGTINGAGGLQVATNYVGSSEYNAGNYSGPILTSDSSVGVFLRGKQTA